MEFQKILIRKRKKSPILPLFQIQDGLMRQELYQILLSHHQQLQQILIQYQQHRKIILLVHQMESPVFYIIISLIGIIICLIKISQDML